MPDTYTKNLNLSYIYTNQAQKEVLVNEALLKIDALLNTGAKSRAVNTPPVSPSEGDLYIIPSPAYGAWAGHGNKISYYHPSKGWVIIQPNEGITLWVADEDKLYAFNGTLWAAAGGGETADKFGINATADNSNKLAVKSDAVLFDHNGTDSRVKVSKAAAGDTASHLFQNNYSGRAEFGLCGDDDFHIKVSADGSSWSEALIINRATAAVTPGQPAKTRIAFNILRGIVQPETQALMEAMTSAPNRKRTFLIDDTISVLKEKDLWNKLDLLYILAAHDSQSAKLNWKNPSLYNLAEYNSPTFTANQGFTGNGTSAYLDSGFNVSSAAGRVISQNSAHISVYAITGSATYAMDAGLDTANNLRVMARSSSTNLATVNSATNITWSAGAAPNFVVATRNDATNVTAYEDAASSSGAATSAAIPSANFVILRATGVYTDRRVAMASLGSGLSLQNAADIRAVMTNYLTNVGIVV